MLSHFIFFEYLNVKIYILKNNLNICMLIQGQVLFLLFISKSMYLSNLSTMGRIHHKVNFLSGVQLVGIQSFLSPRPIFLPKLKRLLYYLPIAGVWKKNWLMPFMIGLVWSKMQTASARISTWVISSISYNNNCYTKCAFFYLIHFKKYCYLQFTFKYIYSSLWWNNLLFSIL